MSSLNELRKHIFMSQVWKKRLTVKVNVYCIVQGCSTYFKNGRKFWFSMNLRTIIVSK